MPLNFKAEPNCPNNKADRAHRHGRFCIKQRLRHRFLPPPPSFDVIPNIVALLDANAVTHFSRRKAHSSTCKTGRNSLLAVNESVVKQAGTRPRILSTGGWDAFRCENPGASRFICIDSPARSHAHPPTHEPRRSKKYYPTLAPLTYRQRPTALNSKPDTRSTPPCPSTLELLTSTHTHPTTHPHTRARGIADHHGTAFLPENCTHTDLLPPPHPTRLN